MACVTVYSILPDGEVISDTAQIPINQHNNVLYFLRRLFQYTLSYSKMRMILLDMSVTVCVLDFLRYL